MSPPGPLAALRRLGALDAVDVHFARLVERLSGGDSSEVALGAALASQWTGGGHACVDLHQVAGQVLATEADGSVLRAPELAPWLAALRASPAVGAGGEFRPLVLDAAGRLYLRRYYEYELEVAAALDARAHARPAPAGERAAAGIERLFPSTGQAPDWQRVAAACALLNRLCVISGGPGTGKTTTVVRMLALLGLAWSAERAPRVALAAPTGKAAARLQEAVNRAAGDLGAEAVSLLPEQASTLHRLLGMRPGGGARHGADNPLPLDVLVIDEASMVDLALMAAVLRALPAEARLVLLGDRHQLASVEAGAVLGALCAGPIGYSDRVRAPLEALAGATLPHGRSAVGDGVVELTHSYRFRAESAIGRLADAVRAGDADAVQTALAGDDSARWLACASPAELGHLLGPELDRGYRAYAEAVAAGAQPGEVLARLGRFRVLSATRAGPWGVDALNRLAESRLRSAGLIAARGAWYPGRAVMITRNDYALGLFNGDTGVALPDPGAGGALRVFFEVAGGVRAVSPGRLSAHETVFAMTVHKSQGSEFERVLLVLPGEPGPVLSRELVYTAVTRARSAVAVAGREAVLGVGVARSAPRVSGLRDRLWGEVAACS